MKFTDYLFHPGVRIPAILLGLLIGGGTAVFTNWKMGAFVGAIAVLVLSVVIPIMIFAQDLPYIRIKKKLPQPFLLDVRVSLTSKNGLVDGFFILTENSMILLSISNGTHSLELSREDVRSVRSGENYSIHIFLNDTQLIRLRTPSSDLVLQILEEKGWC